MSAPAPDRLISALSGRYAIERELGRGGMATVYLARDVKHRRQVAIKVLRPDLAAVLGPERFLREVEIAATLNHPHILALHDSGEAGGFLFYVMPYVLGGSLRQRLAMEHQLPVEETLTLARQIASALEHAHSRKVIHRDIKPENILLHEGEAMVADFGIARAVSAAGAGEQVSEAGLLLGTLEYMSPEQALGERDLDARSDVYSLGCLVYELLAGEPPFTGRTAPAILAKQFADQVPGVRRLRATVSATVEQAITKALAKMPVDRHASAAAFAAELTAAPAAALRENRPSIAVLPFLNLSADPENEFFADGITEDVIAQLSKVGALQVIARTSVMRFKKREQSLRDIAATLQVGSILEGSVRRAGDRVRIVAQLIEAETDQHLWTETYDRQLTDIFEIQADVAMKIAAALRAELEPEERSRIRREPTRDLEAYQLYMQGRHWSTRYTVEGFRKGLTYLEQAVARDPHFALAHSGLALAWVQIGIDPGSGIVAPAEAYRRARASVQRALALDSGLGLAHGILALLRFVVDFDWQGAEEEFRLALELSPNSADIHDHYGWLCSSQGRHEEEFKLVKRARELDPMAHGSDVASSLLRAGRFAEAEKEAIQAVEFDPRAPRAHSTLAWARFRLGRTAEGIAELEKAVGLDPENTVFIGQLGQALAEAGRTDEARKILQRLQQMAGERIVSPYHTAYVYTGLGDHDAALTLLERAYEQHSGGIYGIKGSFLFRTLHQEPRFIALLRKMNLA